MLHIVGLLVCGRVMTCYATSFSFMCFFLMNASAKALYSGP